ncbi:disintegrin and metalloproteinase domain-containing protein 10-like [Centruroides vittatus]|uniref:disintegrin and metalloproteinase domain-containing protein 10-like n=1 Tax=Centruroides vittatus TaxID=120091 RepID=UPI00350F2AD4
MEFMFYNISLLSLIIRMSIIGTSNLQSLNLLKNYKIVKISRNFESPFYSNIKNLLTLRFHAFDEYFDILLYVDETLTSSNSLVEIYKYGRILKKSLRDLNDYFIYQGIVRGRNYSKVSGYFYKTFFIGSIDLFQEIYYLEPAFLYLNDTRYGYQTIIYKESDVKYLKCKSTNENENASCKKTHYNFAKSSTDYRLQNFKVRKIKEKKICGVELIADHTFFKEMGKNYGWTIAEMLYHLKTSDKIFRSTDFDGDARPDNIGFSVDKITIYESKNEKNYPMARISHRAEYFLNDLSYHVQNYCLAICFCYREFKKNVLGMSYRATSDTTNIFNNNSYFGGICAKSLSSIFRSPRSLNVAFITGVSKSKRLPKPMVSIELTHELGHSFGSYDDPQNNPICSPGDFGSSLGNFIMYPFVSEGYEPNKKLFSTCSTQEMLKIIYQRRNCFKESVISVCGNAITENEEECDCGTNETCRLIDKCCTPKGGIGRDKECSFKKTNGAKCSPREGECCTEQCNLIPANKNFKCHKDFACYSNVTCNGKSQFCPIDIKNDGIPCLGNYLTCKKGKCISNVCQDHNLKSCQCASSDKKCHVCCLDNNEVCRSAEEFGYFTPEGKVFMKLAGIRCDRTSVCDDNGRCIFKSRSLHWIYLMLVFIILILIISLYVLQFKFRF